MRLEYSTSARLAVSRARVSEWEFGVFMRKNVRGTRADVLFSNERRDQGTRTKERCRNWERKGVKEKTDRHEKERKTNP